MHVLTQQSLFARLGGLAESAIVRLNDVSLSLPQLVARFAVAGVFFRSGLAKIANWDLTVQLFQDEYRLPLIPPELAALMGAGLELSVPVFLVLGFITRIAALPLIGMTTVIQLFVYPQNWPEHLTWVALLLLLVLRGGGAWSVDSLIARAWRQGRW